MAIIPVTRIAFSFESPEGRSRNLMRFADDRDYLTHSFAVAEVFNALSIREEDDERFMKKVYVFALKRMGMHDLAKDNPINRLLPALINEVMHKSVADRREIVHGGYYPEIIAKRSYQIGADPKTTRTRFNVVENIGYGENSKLRAKTYSDFQSAEDALNKSVERNRGAKVEISEMIRMRMTAGRTS